jgi:hypothetical protein
MGLSHDSQHQHQYVTTPQPARVVCCAACVGVWHGPADFPPQRFRQLFVVLRTRQPRAVHACS